ncbi:MAG TPA: NADH-quinone oxidoreductase subunit L [Chthonomonadaceae bacterium]|nr:NADH-quinone oxidoreductase subunit L [Chthonomonadaceae bacterium]
MESWAWLIVWLPLLGFLFNAVSGLIFGKQRARRLVAYVAPGVVLAAFVLAVVATLQVMGAPDHRVIVPLIPGASATAPWIDFAFLRVNFALLLDPLLMLMALIVTGVGGLIHVYATGYMADDPEQPRFFTYFNLFIFMMLLLVLAENFLLLFVGWEGVGTCSYLLISFWYTDPDNARAGNKAFIVNRVGDLGFVLGMLTVWSVFGTFSFFTADHKGVMDLAMAHKDFAGHPLGDLTTNFFGGITVPTLTLMCLLLFVGACGKSAQIPLWTWLPDAMAGPTPVSALIHAATMVTAGVVMVSRCSWLFVQAPGALRVVAVIGLATAFLGASIGLVQNDIKRVLAYSTISQLGYMFLACGVGAFTWGMFHVTTHAFFKALLFLGSGAVIHSMLGEQDMRKMGGLRKLIPATWAVMFVGTYAIAGFPFLFSGFWSKDAILDSALRSPWGDGLILYAVGLFTAFMTAFYMNRLMWKTFYTDPRFVNGELVELHHGASEEEHEPEGDHTGHEEETTGHAAHAAQHEHGGGYVHSSPPSMMFPLYILALLSIVAGIILYLNGAFRNFLAPSIAPLSLGGLEEGGEIFPQWMGWIISGVVAIGGLILARVLYQQNMQTGELIPEERKEQMERVPLNPYTFLLNKWWWDWLYNKLFIEIGGLFAEGVLWKTIDIGIIDRFVNTLAGAVGRVSSTTRRVETGYVRNYALGMLLGVVALLIGLLVGLRGH